MKRSTFAFFFAFMSFVASCGGTNDLEEYADIEQAYQAFRTQGNSQIAKRKNSVKLNLNADLLPTTDGEEVSDFAQYLRIYSGCEVDPETTIVVNNLAREDLCQGVVITPVGGVNGDTYEVYAFINWIMQDPDVVSLEFPLGPNNNLARVHGHQDIFDAADFDEPSSALRVCGVNNCSSVPEEYGCESSVCSDVTYISVINTESTWKLTGTMIPAGLTMNPLQSGRKFADDSKNIQHGFVYGDKLRFQIDDHLFFGTFSDRKFVSGPVIETATFMVVGSWQASR